MSKEMKECTKCPLCKTRKQVVVGEGNEKSPVMLIGECPGPVEDAEGRPFIGKAGQFLRNTLLEAGIDPGNLYITNLVKCFPFSSLNPSKEHIAVCSPWLDAQILQLNPKLIVTLGKLSSSYVLNIPSEKLSITKISGQLQKIGERYILPVVHPSFVLRGGKKHDKFMVDLLPILDFCDG